MKIQSGSDGLSNEAAAKYAEFSAVAAAPATLPAPVVTQGEHESHPREMAHLIATRLLVGDLLAAFVSVFVGLQVRAWHADGFLTQSWATEARLVGWSAAGAVAFSVIMGALRTYDTRNLYRMHLVLRNLLKGGILWTMFVLAAIGFLHTEGYQPQISLAYAVVSLAVGFTAWRLASFAWMLQPSVRKAACSRIVIVGWNDKAAHLRDAMNRDLSQLGEVIGCVPSPGGRFAVRPPEGVEVLGDYSSLPSLIRSNRVDAVILSDVTCPQAEVQHLVNFCQREYVSFQMIPEYFSALTSSLQVQNVSGVPLLGVHQLPLDRMLNRAMKRAVDVGGALVGLAISALIVPWFCMMVYLESPGPVIYRQRRTSRGGRDFFIYKIRSMKLNAETGSGAVWCKKEDDRRLKIGAFMRKTNIDELPQFWNVLKGDMSLVGPRPERPELIEKFKHEIPNYNVRHKVRAGLTGWAAINGWRGDTDLTKRVEADIYYMENWSVFLDLYCLVATFFKIKNAY